MIKTFKERGIESPWFYIVSDDMMLEKFKKRLSFPCIIKPIDNSGSRGVTIVNNIEQLNDSYLYSKMYSRNGSVIIEEFMTGNEVSVEIIVINGEPNVLAVTDKLTTGAPHFVEMGHSQQSQLSNNNVEKLRISCSCRKSYKY